MNYKMIETSELNCYAYKVLETTTNQIIKTFTLQKEAKEFMRHLNLGGAFDGFTPTFILKTTKNKN